MITNQIECYKSTWLIKEVSDAVHKVSCTITNTANLENRIYQYVGAYLGQDAENIKNRRYLRRMIYAKTNEALLTSRKEDTTLFSSLTVRNENGEDINYEPEDVLADVASRDLELTETITLLAKDDRRKTMILNAWANGYTDNADISYTLASVLGGKSETHRKFIQRFKIECRKSLEVDAA